MNEIERTLIVRAYEEWCRLTSKCARGDMDLGEFGLMVKVEEAMWEVLK